MNKIFGFLWSKKYYLLGILVVAAAVYYFAFLGQKRNTESYTVALADVEQSVVLSGDVRTSDRADLGFAASGRIDKIYVTNNQEVRQGQILARLEIGELLADLRIKKINATTSGVDLAGAKEDLERVTAQENAKVDSAYRSLLSEGIVLTPNSMSYDVATPLITGAYAGGEGTYKVSIEKENPTLNNFTLRTFDLEKTTVEINEEAPTVFGTRGLYISFPDDLDSYHDTIWYLEIPNKASSSYLANLNTWNEAKENRDRAVKAAELEYQKLLTEKNGGESLVIQAEIDKINAEIRKNTIYAPFSGKATNLEKKVGENASSGERVISVLGEERLEVVLQVSELDVSRLVPGSTIAIFLDAFPGEEFSGTLRTVNSKETEVDGVPVYEAFVELPADPRIKTGMSAKAEATLAQKNDVLAVPSYLIKKTEGKSIVTVILADGRTEERNVVLGLSGTDNMVEIISGLSAGEKIAADVAGN